jgi:hypothetical protein
MRLAGERWLRGALVAVPLVGLASLVVGIVAPASPNPVAGDAIEPLRAAAWIGRILLTAAAVTAAVLGPGLVLRRHARAAPLDGLPLIWIPGTLYLAASGLAAWLLASEIDPQVTSTVALTPLLAWLAWRAAKASVRSWFRPGEAAVCGLMLVVVLIAVGKATRSTSLPACRGSPRAARSS